LYVPVSFSKRAGQNLWLRRSGADLAMLTTATSNRPCPYGGVPWYSTPFGRDGILTALEYLWVNPALASGVLTFLARAQAEEADPANDAEPGKILHEARTGELATLGEIPCRRYYGSIESTPLFIVLAGAYYQRTANLNFARLLWPAVERALDWIDQSGDADGDGFVEYQRHSSEGLVNQGWKDSED
jgi:glycogen debranching enzyme